MPSNSASGRAVLDHEPPSRGQDRLLRGKRTGLYGVDPARDHRETPKDHAHHPCTNALANPVRCAYSGCRIQLSPQRSCNILNEWHCRYRCKPIRFERDRHLAPSPGPGRGAHAPASPDINALNHSEMAGSHHRARTEPEVPERPGGWECLEPKGRKPRSSCPSGASEPNRQPLKQGSAPEPAK